MTSLRIRGLEFSGRRVNPGFSFGPDGFTGWNDGVDMRRQNVERPQAHGMFDLPGYLDARVVTVFGMCRAASSDQLRWYGSRLTGLLADGDSDQLVVEEAGVTSWQYCRLSTLGNTQFKVITPGFLASYRIQFWCPDPRKLGDAHTFAGGVPAYHYGNFIAAPVLTISGSSPTGYTVNGPNGKQYVVTVALTVGHPHTIDMATGYLTVDGVITTGDVSQADTWGIPAGAQVTMTVTAGSLSTLVRDTYI